MTQHEALVRLGHMLEASREGTELARGKTRRDLTQNRLLELALTRLVEIVGEAASRVPKEDQARFPDIPWADIVGMRNRLVHGYTEIDLEALWSTIEEDRPTLRDLARHAFVIPPARSRWRREAGCPWAADAGGYRRLIRNGRRDAVAGGGGEEGGVGGDGNPRRH
jgi:uncharacterized protein with HEPN domain